MVTNIIIIDDERRSRALLRSMIESLNTTINIVAEAYDIPTSIQAVQEYNPDLVFLDIQLKDGTGFDILHHFQQPDFKVIFITAHNQYALEAFKVYAVDYLLKPVDKDQLSIAVTKALREIQLNQKEHHLH